MDFVVSGGGTAGHINPALALADELKAAGQSVFFAGTPQGVESRLAPQAGLPFVSFEASGFNRNHPASMLKALRLVRSSTAKAKQWLAELRPACVVCFGGYVCIPVGRAAISLGIPVVVHEQNSVMGMANKYLARRATRVALTYEAAGVGLSLGNKAQVTGNPVRRSVFDADRCSGRAYCQVPQDACLLVVFGGSLGARHINQAIAAHKDELLSREGLYVRHITGPKEYEQACLQLALSDVQAQRWQLVSYEDNMGMVLAAADAVVSRAGATSLAEISALRIPALLVPFPYATADHQSANAREYVQRGAAFLVPDDQVESEQFAEKLFALVDDEALRESMRAAAATFETQDAAKKLADLVLDAASAS